jgi:hypothetical protein
VRIAVARFESIPATPTLARTAVAPAKISVFHEVHGRALPFDLKTCGGYYPQGSLFSYPQTANFEPRTGFAWSPEALHGNSSPRRIRSL